MRYLSTAAAALRPSAIAQTISDCPRPASPATKIPSSLVSKSALRAIRIVETKFENGKFEPVVKSHKEIRADFVFLALGFTGPEQSDLISQLEVKLDDRGIIARNADFETSEEGIFVAGDAGRGQSLIVWAIAEGRSAAAAVDKYLTGETQLPSPIEPTTHQLMV